MMLNTLHKGLREVERKFLEPDFKITDVTSFLFSFKTEYQFFPNIEGPSAWRLRIEARILGVSLKSNPLMFETRRDLST